MSAPPEVEELRALVARLAAVLCPDRLRPWVAELDEAWSLVANVAPDAAGLACWALFVESGASAGWLCLTDAERPWLGSGEDLENALRVARLGAENAEAALARVAHDCDPESLATRDTEPPAPDAFEPFDRGGPEATKAAGKAERKAPWDV